MTLWLPQYDAKCNGVHPSCGRGSRATLQCRIWRDSAESDQISPCLFRLARCDSELRVHAPYQCHREQLPAEGVSSGRYPCLQQ